MNEPAPHLEILDLPSRPLPAEQVLADVRAEADRIRTEAIEAASRTRLTAQIDARTAQQAKADAATDRAAAARALTDAQRTLTAAEEKTAKAEQRSAFTDTWGPRAALAATIVLTASGEFALAKFSGWPWQVAWALPVSIDVYVVQAFRRHRDVAGALILMVVANAIYHLAAAGLIGVETKGAHKGDPLWWLIVGVAAIAPWVMWRIHRITDDRSGERERPADARERLDSERPDAQPSLSEVPVSAPGERPSERASERAQVDAHERPALTEHAHGRAHPGAQWAPSERAQSVAAGAHQAPRVSALITETTSTDERPVSAPSERPMSARKAPKSATKSAPKKAAKSDAQRQDEIVRALYDTLNRRPEWTEIRTALTSAKLANPESSRSTMQRVRERVEKREPALAARGSDNVRALAATGTDN